MTNVFNGLEKATCSGNKDFELCDHEASKVLSLWWKRNSRFNFTEVNFFLFYVFFFSFKLYLNFQFTVSDFVFLNVERDAYCPRCFWWVVWRQAFPYTVTFPPKQMEIHPLPCFLTLLISCHHRNKLKSGFPPNWPKAWRCYADFPLPTAVPLLLPHAAIP